METIRKINWQNQVTELEEGTDVNEVLEALEIDTNSIQMEVEGDTLYLLAKAGTKGAGPEEISVEDLLKAIYGGCDEDEEVEEVSARDRVKLVDGKLVREETLTEKLAKFDKNRVKEEVVEEEVVAEPEVPTRKEVKLVDGKLVEVVPLGERLAKFGKTTYIESEEEECEEVTLDQLFRMLAEVE